MVCMLWAFVRMGHLEDSDSGLIPRVRPQLYAENLKCVSSDPALLFKAARFTTGYVRLVGQEPAPSKCVLLLTSREVRKDMRSWVPSEAGERWSVRFDVRDLGGHIDTSLSHLDFHGFCRCERR